jgi:molybdate transport system substrate-binding protein
MTRRPPVSLRAWLVLGVLALLAGVAPALAAGTPKPGILVFAASSLTDAMTEIGAEYEQASGAVVTLSFAASSALARQIEAGAPADVFISADPDWMDYLQSRRLIQTATRTDVVGNRLVLIAPAGAKVALQITPHFALAAALGTGRLATGDPDSVPVGRYARAALTALGVWDSVADRLVRAENVRVALAFVARGEAPLGIVYATDALIEPRVRIVAVFPADTHPPITYPLALTHAAAPAALPFVTYLRGATAAAIFRKYGFMPRSLSP